MSDTIVIKIDEKGNLFSAAYDCYSNYYCDFYKGISYELTDERVIYLDQNLEKVLKTSIRGKRRQFKNQGLTFEKVSLYGEIAYISSCDLREIIYPE